MGALAYCLLVGNGQAHRTSNGNWGFMVTATQRLLVGNEGMENNTCSRKLLGVTQGQL